MPAHKARCTVAAAGQRGALCGQVEARSAASSPNGYWPTITTRCHECGSRVCRDYRCSVLLERLVAQTARGRAGTRTPRRRQVRVCLPCALRWAKARDYGAALTVELAQARLGVAQGQVAPQVAGRLERQLEAWHRLQLSKSDPTHDARLRAAEAM